MRLTGGLDDSVIDITEDADEPDGTRVLRLLRLGVGQSHPQSPRPLLQGPGELLDVYRRNGMAKNFTWANTAQEYTALYQRLLPPA